jgi:hypothetical protein
LSRSARSLIAKSAEPVVAPWMSSVVWPSVLPAASSGSLELADTRMIDGVASQLSTAVTDARTLAILWFGGHRYDGTVVTVTTGAVSSSTVTEHTADELIVPLPHSTVTSVEPSPYGPPGAHVVVTVPPRGLTHVATAAHATSAEQVAPADTVGARQVMAGTMTQEPLHPSLSTALPSSQASPGSLIPLPHESETVSTPLAMTSERQTGSGLLALTSHRASWSVPFGLPGAPLSPPG